MKQAVLGIAALALSGCVVNISDSAPDGAEPVPPPPAPMVCNAAAAQSHVGRNASQSTGEAIIKDSGARSLRWGPPNAAWTMDYREDRVNVYQDASGNIERIGCG